MKKTALTIIAILALAAGCATNPATGKSDLVLMSEKDEIAIGKQVNQQVLQRYRIYGDPELQSYVQHIGEKVAANSHRSHLEYRFTVLDSPDVNAFALPGGYIYITRGLMAYLNSEAELAAVLGHEVGHITARHAVRQHSASQLTAIGTTLGAAIGGAFVPGLGQAGQQLGGVLGTALLRGYGREHELEADRLGAEYLARTGYDPNAMMDVIRVLKNQELYEFRAARAQGREPRVYHGVFSTHPDSDTRLQEVIAHAGGVTPVESPQVGREDYLQRLDGMVYGEGSSQGIVRGRDFYHGHLGFALRFPAGWAISNMHDHVIARAPGQGAIIHLSVRPADPRLSPQEFLGQMLQQQRLGNERSLEIHGLKAHTATAPINTDIGQRPARITVIYLNRRAFVMAGIPRETGALGRYDASFLDTAGSFRPLTAGERKVAMQETRIRTRRAEPGTSFAALAQTSPLKEFQEEQVRLINGRYPRGDIAPGEMIKVLE
jgi:predicted Zn-dependent protease